MHGLQQKFFSCLAACVEIGAEVIVMPDVGCGVFQNPPAEVGMAFAIMYDLRSSFFD